MAVNISDHPTLGLKRQVEWRTFVYSAQEKNVRLYTVCNHFSGSYDVPFSSNAVKSFERILRAENSRVVNPDNGLVATDVDGSGSYVDVSGNPVTGSPVPQFDYFESMIHSSSVDIPTLIENIILQEDVYFDSYN